MENPHPIAALRQSLGLTLDEFGARIGLASRGGVSVIERGGRCSVKVALAIEEVSNGAINADSLNEDVARVRCRDRSMALTDSAAPHPAETGNSFDLSETQQEVR